MSQPSPSDRLIALFAPWMAERGFTYRKSGHVFRRPFANGIQTFMLQFDGRGGFVTVRANYKISFDEISAIQKKHKWIEGQAGRYTRLNFGVPEYCDLYLDQYMAMTPLQRKGITSETTHPQELIEAGLAFLKNVYTRLAEPIFNAAQTEQQLADLYIEHMTGKEHPSLPFLPQQVGMLLAYRLEDRRAELLEAVGQTGPWHVHVRNTVDETAAALEMEMPVERKQLPGRLVPL